ncbi:cytochrome-c oxidase, cbb3-type subunit III [Pseudomarimonas salicorniae]|uniref:Cbb3-type cytochrome c oxidase subunit n=1 Tax=Pseudomarimonas salicorniae TaxID=2933270 RepID=A0ABT0GEI0_9GAMM|nr:cytochrome-c oxidase, cbb3-type subunit III [Lysobacter sp. CAU 1642]MCK7592757.1 cytochrome-c oxidase, cbb3-type subunit III [Lysobacter sp. CAU 1642]
MGTFWSIFIILLVVLNIAGCIWLLWWTSKRRPGEPETTGHVWDGDIREYNKPLPRWWINLFYITIVFTVGYLIWYPGAGSFAGTSGWTSAKEHAADRAVAEAKIMAALAPFEGQPIDVLARNPQAVEHGRSVFAANCATCHGSDARGARGFPNLADGSWQWGRDPQAVLTSILDGRQAAMPPFAAVLGSDRAVLETGVYVQSLSGQPVDPALAAAGKPRFANVCAACHGAEGKGNPALGAPDLTDDVWLYGGDFDAIRTAIVKGRAGAMPAHEPLIGETRARLAGAWVWSLSHGDASTAGSGTAP